MAINHALDVLHWQENLLPDEMPPEWMWPIPDELEDWFSMVEANRRDQSGISRDDRQDAPDMMTNELSRGRR